MFTMCICAMGHMFGVRTGTPIRQEAVCHLLWTSNHGTLFWLVFLFLQNQGFILVVSAWRDGIGEDAACSMQQAGGWIRWGLGGLLLVRVKQARGNETKQTAGHSVIKG